MRLTGLPALACLMPLLSGCTTPGDSLAEFEAVTPATMLEAPPPSGRPVSGYSDETVTHGKYLVELLGCGSCHTDGALIGRPNNDRRLAGSRVGIAYSNPLLEQHPGVVYPSNLTPDPDTGLGNWTDAEILRMIRGGIDRHGRQQLSIMPWPAYRQLTDTDAGAIVAYLRSLEPVSHRVPDNAQRGQPAPAPFVHFGVYRGR